MNIKSENGMVTFIMKAGKDKVRSSMSLAEANRIVSSAKDVVETATEVIVNDTYFFPIEKKSHKKSKVEEMTDDE